MSDNNQCCNMDERTNEEKLIDGLQEKLSSQADTYMNMFDAACVERKWLIRENKHLEGSVKNITLTLGRVERELRAANKSVKRLSELLKEQAG